MGTAAQQRNRGHTAEKKKADKFTLDITSAMRTNRIPEEREIPIFNFIHLVLPSLAILETRPNFRSLEEFYDHRIQAL